ncbi:hypothetical protein [Legionella pneumophila]|uniref:Dot/Icm T4SS effector n=1 Tax=Legionella pneumophila subsp. pascullei TaxID=91890 RepID=A0AAX2IY30_LEGPN|nr:hypothetical protein [Legionella pneumophila]AMP88999.1 hypothetical protein AXF35_04570 [Legionella pneumophila subsp. pascullei]AMP93333.1 hypothetical protein AXF36_12220 [Legionella pneumophila subsp. pascullei]AMP96299.1 hypothetical protein AXF37_12110 [Legionella pneumophila subsp. pascullei]SQG91265.1 Dot/Icm T4SS effector [Legionella pneumophila subsp. pascullei]VEH07811.1 Dot/Icm T4SS effector [Legionella pneumophila subsp. pascullei]
MTPLFPEKNTPLTIKQGPVDDCYLLVALDCIFNSGDEARQLLAAKFTQTPLGLTVRIKRNNQSTRLDSQKMRGKYIHVYDRNTDEDVFFIGQQKLKEIDNSKKGVQTNSLAIKVLERISSYYYTGDWDHTNESGSLTAHSIRQRHMETSTRFVGKLLGIHAEDTEEMDAIIKLKLMNPKEAVYISFAYGEPDANGKIHERHALRIDKVVTKTNGGYDFILVNPWDNQKQEIFSLEELEKRDCRFCTFSLNQQRHEITRILLKNPIEQGQYIFANPELFNLLLQMQKLSLLSDAKNIQVCINLHKQMPYLASLYNSLTSDEQKKLIQGMVDTKGDTEKFIKHLIINVPRLDLIKTIIQHEPLKDKTEKTIVDLALEAKKKLSPARIVFENAEFFTLIMNRAIHHKANIRGCSQEHAKKLIESKLIYYYFDNLRSDSLTRNAGLSELFAAKIFTKTSIEAWFATKLSLAHVDLSQALKTLGFSDQRSGAMSAPVLKKQTDSGAAQIGFFPIHTSSPALVINKTPAPIQELATKKSSVPTLPSIVKKPSTPTLPLQGNGLSIYNPTKQTSVKTLPPLKGVRITPIP